jgi:hypothetical protein
MKSTARPTLTADTIRIVLGRTTGTPGTHYCNVYRAILNGRNDGKFSCHIYLNGSLIKVVTYDLPGTQEYLTRLLDQGYAEVL